MIPYMKMKQKRRGVVLEKIIGIFDEQMSYAERLKQYINEKKEIGCFAVTFQKEEDLLEYCRKKKLFALLVGETCVESLKEELTQFDNTKLWVISEEEPQEWTGDGMDRLFRYQKAGELVRRILSSEPTDTEKISELYTVFSPEQGRLAEEYAWNLIEKLVQKGKCLLLPWDPFLGYGKENAENPSVSELLYLVRKDKEQARQLFLRLPRKNGAEYFGSPDFCTDLWQYSAEEMKRLIHYCRETGGYQCVIFLAGTFHEGVLAVMNQSSEIFLVTSENRDGLRRKQEFFRQMKYAGEQEILSRLTETALPFYGVKTEEMAWKN